MSRVGDFSGGYVMRTFLKAAIGVLAATGIAGSANAATASASFTVTASVAAACTIGASNLAFGAYTGSQVDINSTVTANCITGTTYSIALNAGIGAGATTTVRKLTSGANTLNYALYSDAGHSAIWGTGVDAVSDTGSGAPQSKNVYGRIAAGLTPAAGSYTDTVTATITF